MASNDEHSLASRARQGDRDAFAGIVRNHQQAVFNVAYRMLGNIHDAEDAAQETFLRAWQFFDKFDADRPLAPWLKRIAANVCINRLEAAKPASGLDEEADPAPDPNSNPEAQTVDRDRHQRIRLELSRLPPRYRIVIELRHYQEMSYEEIAKELNQPLSNIKSDLFRARRLLAERLKDLK